MRVTSPWILAAGAALACAAGPHPAAPSAAVAAPGARGAASSPAAGAVSRGMDAAQVRGALGEPARKERIGSVAAPGVGYERWIYADREIVLLDGKVVDVLP